MVVHVVEVKEVIAFTFFIEPESEAERTLLWHVEIRTMLTAKNGKFILGLLSYEQKPFGHCYRFHFISQSLHIRHVIDKKILKVWRLDAVEFGKEVLVCFSLQGWQHTQPLFVFSMLCVQLVSYFPLVATNLAICSFQILELAN
jgi:hypothetical protein